MWPYILASLLAIIIKHTIRIKGRHLFNPNNIALVLLLFFLPEYAVSTPKQWTNGWDVMSMILFLGCLAAYAANRLDTVISFFIGFSSFALIRHVYFDEPLLFALGPMFGAAFQLFAFFMITDPQTTPAAGSARIVFALLIAFVDALLRVLDITNSLFYAAFLVTLFAGIPYRFRGFIQRG